MFDRHVKFLRISFSVDLSNQYSQFLIMKFAIIGTETKLIGIAPFAQYDSKVYP
jgi:hypothetical protein